MSEVPKVGGQPGTYEKKWSQWFLERSFFRDFVYRNPRGKKKGQELADAVVLFDDVVLMVQVKAQCGRHDPMSWATEKLLEAFKQLCETHESLVRGQIKKLKNDFYGEIEFDPAHYPNRIGLIILAHKSRPYLAAKLAPEILTAGFPVHVFSSRDFGVKNLYHVSQALSWVAGTRINIRERLDYVKSIPRLMQPLERRSGFDVR